MAVKFLCCLSARVGVFVIAVFQLLINGALAFLFWFAVGLAHRRALKVPSGPLAAIFIYAIVFTVGFLMAILGLIGMIRRKYNLIGVFLRLMIYMAIYMGVYTFITVSSLLSITRIEYIESCADGTNDQVTLAECASSAAALDNTGARAIIIVIFLIPNLLQLYGCYIVNAYHNQLQKEKYAIRNGVSSTYSRGLKRASWTIDGPDVEPPDWGTVSAQGSDIELAAHQKRLPDDDLETIPLTSSINAATTNGADTNSRN